jgi:hypothetical protein
VAFEPKQEARAVKLPKEVWLEIDCRAGLKGISISDIIKEALHTYFDLTGQVTSEDGGGKWLT